MPYYNRLKEAGIFHQTPQSAAAKVAEIWGDVPTWRNQQEIQEARELFCYRYARTISNPKTVLKSILLSIKE